MTPVIDSRAQSRVSVARDALVHRYEPARVGRLVQQALEDLGLDSARRGTSSWNPLADIALPGARVVLKPNWVSHQNQGPGGTDCLITHHSLILELLEYVWRIQPSSVIIGDAPVQGCDFDALLRLGLNDALRALDNPDRIPPVRDFRRKRLQRQGGVYQVHESCRPESEYLEVDLGRDSLLEPISAHSRLFRVTMYDPREMQRYHGPGFHRYVLTRDILAADLVINLAKLKTHKKAGMTAALKNLVGINGIKDCLPHHRRGGADAGADNYERTTVPKTVAERVLDFANRHRNWPRTYPRLLRIAERLLQFERWQGGSADVEGSWYGNDTVWRMCLDLNKLLMYADASGVLQPSIQRVVLSVADGIIGGEGEGPLSPDPKPAGLISAALNPAAHDYVVSRVMGFNPDQIPAVRHAFDTGSLPIALFAPSEIRCWFDGQACPLQRLPNLHFRPAAGWRGHCELP